MRRPAACPSLRGARLLRGWSFETRWRLGVVAVSALSAIIAGTLLMAVILASDELRHLSGGGASPALTLLVLLAVSLTAGGACGYLYVGARKERSYELHAHGFVLFAMMTSACCTLATRASEATGDCTLYSGSFALGTWLWGVQKATLILLMKRKMLALGRPARRCAHPRPWAHALVLAVLVYSAAVGGASGMAFFFILAGLTSCDGFWGVVAQGESEPLLLAVLVCVGIAGVVLVIAGTGMLCASTALRRRAKWKLKERQVPGEMLFKVQHTILRHVLGVFASILTSQLSMLGVGAVTLFSEVRGEGELPLSLYVLDNVGDLIGILLLSDIGSLLFVEDPDKGDISGQIRGLLNSAVMAGRAEMVFEGSLEAAPDTPCVVSFPGKYVADWQAMTWACEQGDISSACVFLPQADPQGRFGEHARRAETPGKCWCHSLYGSEKLWGCAWFVAWQHNIQIAVDRNLELVVVYFPKEVGMGVVAWDDLPQSNLWDGLGLGGSQKAEVAYLRLHGIAVTELDLEDFRDRVSRIQRRSVN